MGTSEEMQEFQEVRKREPHQAEVRGCPRPRFQTI